MSDVQTPKPQEGTWTLTAPDGRVWQADSPMHCARLEQRERVPAEIAIARIRKEIEEVEMEVKAQEYSRYLAAKLAMVVPLFEEARDALCAITETQRKLHRISSTLADRMDEAGTYSIEKWKRGLLAHKPDGS
jgi:Lon protease-like protein